MCKRTGKGTLINKQVLIWDRNGKKVEEREGKEWKEGKERKGCVSSLYVTAVKKKLIGNVTKLKEE